MQRGWMKVSGVRSYRIEQSPLGLSGLSDRPHVVPSCHCSFIALTKCAVLMHNIHVHHVVCRVPAGRVFVPSFIPRRSLTLLSHGQPLLFIVSRVIDRF